MLPRTLQVTVPGPERIGGARYSQLAKPSHPPSDRCRKGHGTGKGQEGSPKPAKAADQEQQDTPERADTPGSPLEP